MFACLPLISLDILDQGRRRFTAWQVSVPPSSPPQVTRQKHLEQSCRVDILHCTALERYFCFNAAPSRFMPGNTSEKSKKSSWPCPCLPGQTSRRWSGQSWENSFRLCFLCTKEMITLSMYILGINWTQSSPLHFLNSGAGTVQRSCKKVHLRSAHLGSNASQPQPAKQSHLCCEGTKKNSLSSNFAKGNGHCRQNVGKGQEFRLFTRGEYPGWPAVCLTLGRGDCTWRCVGSNLTNKS